MSKVKEYSAMTKDRLMIYTFVALLVLVGVSYISWGVTSLIISAIAVLVAVGIDFLLYKIAADSQLNIMSAAVFGLIVALSYSLGLPSMYSEDVPALMSIDTYAFVLLITAVGMILFKKIQGLAGRKYVNPAAAAKLLVLLPFVNTILLAKDHLWDSRMMSDPMAASGLGVPSLAGPIGYEIVGNNGAASFASYIQTCFGNPAVPIPETVTSNEIYNLMMMQKWHGWVGGASSIAVIIVGIALFVVCRRYIKWRITAAYLGTVALLAFAFAFVYGDPDPLLRVVFHLFIGSSIFLAFFMATDPASTPLTYMGQLLFGVGLGVLTLLIQMYMGFFGGSILALVIMNLTSPLLDKVGKMRPITEKKEPKLPKAKQFASVKVTQCIRCGACMRVCCHKLSPILIKEAFDKNDVEKLSKLQADLCDGCGHCVFVCPARIDLRSSILRSKALLRKK
jgi:electron transport complex protein RnfD